MRTGKGASFAVVVVAGPDQCLDGDLGVDYAAYEVDGRAVIVAEALASKVAAAGG